MEIICILLWVYWGVLLARILASWVSIPPSGPIRRVMDIVYDLTEPVLRPLRSLLPPLRMGAVAFDMSAVIVFIVIGILQAYVC